MTIFERTSLLVVVAVAAWGTAEAILAILREIRATKAKEKKSA